MTTVAEKWAGVLGEIGVRSVFGIPSGPWVEYMEALRTSDVEFVLVSNEASAGFMADVCGRITGIPGACYGTFGPRGNQSEHRRGRSFARSIAATGVLANEARRQCPRLSQEGLCRP